MSVILIRNIGEAFTGDINAPMANIGSLLIRDDRIAACNPDTETARTADRVEQQRLQRSVGGLCGLYGLGRVAVGIQQVQRHQRGSAAVGPALCRPPGQQILQRQVVRGQQPLTLGLRHRQARVQAPAQRRPRG